MQRWGGSATTQEAKKNSILPIKSWPRDRVDVTWAGRSESLLHENKKETKYKVHVLRLHGVQIWSNRCSSLGQSEQNNTWKYKMEDRQSVRTNHRSLLQ